MELSFERKTMFSDTNSGFGELNGDIPGLSFAVDPASPYLATSNRFRQQLVDWTYNSASYPVNTGAISFAAMKYAPKACMYFTPEDGATKSGVAAYCYTEKGAQIIIR